MRKLILILSAAITVMGLNAAKKNTIDGVEYKLVENELVCKAADKGKLIDVEIPSTVRIDGMDYFVTEVASRGFSGCNQLKTMVLPNTIKKFGELAFSGCKNLEKIVMPDEAESVIPEGDYGFGRDGIFKGCKSLADARGHDKLYPRYMLYDSFNNCKDTPFYQKILELGSAEMTAMTPPEPNPYATAEAKKAQNITISYVYNGPAKDEEDAPLPTFAPDTVDLQVPVTEQVNGKTFAFIIGNENYKRLAKVDYAVNDAQVFAKYCNLTLGIPTNNIREYHDASLGDILTAVNEIKDIASVYKGEAKFIFYYAGHGVPDEATRNAYLLPIDAAAGATDGCYPLSRLYEELSSVESQSVIAFIDACFSGSVRGDKMLASARGVKLRPKDLVPKGKLIVVSATSGEQTAYPYPEKNHGMFSYYLLKKLNESNGSVSLGELTDYINENVAMQSVTVNHKLQTPSVNFSMDVHDTWRDQKLR